MSDTESWSAYRLLSTAARLVEYRHNRALADLGLSRAAVTTLAAAAATGSVNQDQLAARIGVSGQSLGPVLRRLETAGLLKRRREEADRRNTLVNITAAGHRQLTQARTLDPALLPRAVETSDELRAQLIRIVESFHTGRHGHR